MADDLQTKIEAHENLIRQLQQLASQVNGVQPTPFEQVNIRAQSQFKNDRQQKLNEINRAFTQANENLRQLRSLQARPNPNQPKPLSEAGQLHRQDVAEKKAEDVAAQKPQAELAKNQLEQQKAADAASVPALGAGGRSISDLMTNFSVKRDPDTGNYVFSQPNTSGNLTPLQARNAKALAATMKAQGITDAPEAIFDPTNAPKFDDKGNSIAVPGGNPFIGTKDQYNALARLYTGSQPDTSTELQVPASTLDRVYRATAPAFGPTFPANPVAIDAATPAAESFVGSWLDPNNPANALMQGKAQATLEDIQRPQSLTITGLKDAEGPLAAPAPVGVPQYGPAEPTPDDMAAAGAARLASITKQSPNAAAILANARAQGLDPADPAIQKALAQDSANAAVEGITSKVAPVAGGVLGGISPTGLLARAGRYLTSGDFEGDVDAATAAQEAKDKAARDEAIKIGSLTGVAPLTYEDLNPPGALQ